MEGDFGFEHLALGWAGSIHTHGDFVSCMTMVVASGSFEGMPLLTQKAKEKTPSDSDDTLREEEGPHREIQTHRTGNKKMWCTRNREKYRELVFGKGVSMWKAKETKKIVLVGRVRGWNYTSDRLQRRTSEIYGNILEKLPVVLTMNRGWFSLILPHHDTASWVLTKYWHIEMTSVLLKCWTPL